MLSIVRAGFAGHALCFAFVCTAPVISLASSTNRDHDESFKSQADAYFEPLLRNGSVKAVSIAEVSDEAVLAQATYGPVDDFNTLWRAASVSKALTALAVMQLVQEQRLELDTDINTYLHSFKVPQTYKDPITIRELLEHRSGLDDRFVGDGFRDNGQFPLHTMLRGRGLPKRVYPPNQVEFYSNYGYALLGAVIEDVSGERFEDYLQSHVLNSLGMRSSTFNQPLAAQTSSRMAPGTWWYQRSSPAGALSTTGPDMAAFAIATLNRDNRILSQECFEAMIAGSNPSDDPHHHLGYWTAKRNGRLIIGASGDSGSFHSLLAVIPDAHLGLVILLTGRSVMASWNFYNQFFEKQVGSTPPRFSRLTGSGSTQHSASQVSQWTGFYRTVRYPHHDLSKAFILFDLTHVRAAPDGTLRFDGLRWIPQGAGSFLSEDGNRTISFARAKEGSGTYLGDDREKIHWFETGYANVAFYFLFIAGLITFLILNSGIVRAMAAAGLVYTIGWLTIVLIQKPENLIFGLSLPLKAVLTIALLLPVFGFIALFEGIRHRRISAVAAGLLFLLYLPFISYWNLYWLPTAW